MDQSSWGGFIKMTNCIQIVDKLLKAEKKYDKSLFKVL